MAHFGNGKMMPCVAGGVAVGIGLGIGLAHVWQPASCKAKAPSGPLTLKYWNGRGLMEASAPPYACSSQHDDDAVRLGHAPVGERARC